MSEKNTAVILAGGKGTRLRPYTIAMPKPLVAVGEYPILEIIIRQLKKSNVENIILAVNHQAEMIKAYFGDGSALGVHIQYVLESKPLGTMGPIALMRDILPDNFIVMNGDVLTDLNFALFMKKHIESGSIFSISAFERDHIVDFGVLHINENNNLIDFEEKPSLHYLVSMGIYALNKKVIDYIPVNEYYGFDQLMLQLIEKKQQVQVLHHDGYWNDIGRPSDYERAIEDIKTMEGTYL